MFPVVRSLTRGWGDLLDLGSGNSHETTYVFSGWERYRHVPDGGVDEFQLGPVIPGDGAGDTEREGAGDQDCLADQQLVC